MAGRPKRKSVRQRIEDAKERFRESGKYDPEDVMLAIGIWPDNPPKWALDCCFDLYMRKNRGVLDMDDDVREAMDVLLDEIVKVYFRIGDGWPFDVFNENETHTPPAFTQAFHDASRRSGISLELRAVQKAWNKETQEDVSTTKLDGRYTAAGLPDTPRVSRVFEELVAEKLGISWPKRISNHRTWRIRRDERLRTLRGE